MIELYGDYLAYFILSIIYCSVIVPIVGCAFISSGYKRSFMFGLYLHLFLACFSGAIMSVLWAVNRIFVL